MAAVKGVIESAVHMPVKIDRHGGRNHPADRPRTPDANDAKHSREDIGKHNAQNQIGKRGCHKKLHGTCAAQDTVCHKLCRHDKVKGRQNPQELSACQQGFGGG